MAWDLRTECNKYQINSHLLAAWRTYFPIEIRAHLVPQQPGMVGVANVVHLPH